jgi:hypothetical protein
MKWEKISESLAQQEKKREEHVRREVPGIGGVITNPSPERVSDELTARMEEGAKKQKPSVKDDDVVELFNRYVDHAKKMKEVMGNSFVPIAAMISKFGEVQIIGVVFEDDRGKEQAFQSIYQTARKMHQKGLLAGVITIMDAYSKVYDKDQAKIAAENYKSGDLSRDSDHLECLLGILTRPDKNPLGRMEVYTTDKGTITWQKSHILDGSVEGTSLESNLLPDWTK